jgi:O-antigen/teichoic acid export membrane protein
MLRKSINNLTKPGGSLSQRAVRGGFWVFSLRIVQQLFGLARLVILARILAPHDFGLMGIALLAMSTLETFSQTGFQAALIQKKKDIESYLDAAWTVLILRGLVLFGILYFAAPFAASFFDAPEAKPIIQVIGLSVLFQAFTNIGVIYFQKELKFNKEFIYQLAGTLADFIVAISTVLILRNVWALVFGLLAGNAARCFLSYLIHPYRPRLSRDLKKAKKLFGFGKWILGMSIITFLFNQGDDAFLGKVLGVTALGFYQMAYRIGQLPATEFAKVISTVTFPAYSKLQDNLSKLKAGFLKTLNITVIFMVPLAGGIFMLAPEFTQIFLTQKWTPIVSPLRILVIAGMVRALVTTGGALFQGKGLPNIDYKMNFIRLSILAIAIYPLTLVFGISGTALAVALGNFGCIPIWLTETVKITKISFKEYSKVLFPPFLGTVIMCSIILLIKLTIEINILSFIFVIMLAIATYITVMYSLERLLNVETLSDVKFIIRSLRGAQK